MCGWIASYCAAVAHGGSHARLPSTDAVHLRVDRAELLRNMRDGLRPQVDGSHLHVRKKGRSCHVWCDGIAGVRMVEAGRTILLRINSWMLAVKPWVRRYKV